MRYSGKRIITIAITVLLLLSFAAPLFASVVSYFVDVPQNEWYAEYVNYCYEAGLVAGVGEGYFSPNTNITRGAVARIIWILTGSEEPKETGHFPDVAPGAWYSDAIDRLYENNIMSGAPHENPDGSVTDYAYPDRPVTRGEFVQLVYNMLKNRDSLFTGESSGAAVSVFYDMNKVGNWNKDAVRFAVSCGLLSGNLKKLNNGYYNCIETSAYTTRAAACVILYKLSAETVKDDGLTHYHNYTVPVNTKSPTCKYTGTTELRCAYCNATNVYNLSTTAHAYRKNVVSPNHSRGGYTSYTCTRCGFAYRDNYTSRLPWTKLIDNNKDGKLTVDEYFGAYDIKEHLQSHPSLYLGTPYASIRYYFDTPWVVTRPIGIYGNGAVMNCSGFIAAVFRQVGGDINLVSQEKKGHYGNGYNWIDTLTTSGIFYYRFDNLYKAREAGILRKGYLMFFYPKAGDCHMAFYWGNTSNEALAWHSVYGNQISDISNVLQTVPVYVFPMQN